MKHLAIALIAAVGISVSAARADDVHISGSVNLGTPGYYAPAPYYNSPGYYGAPRGYWKEVPMNVWVPAHWESRVDSWGRAFNYYAPGRYVTRMQRVWVNAYRDRDYREQEWREHERREHEEHEREEHEHDRDGDRGRQGWRR